MYSSLLLHPKLGMRPLVSLLALIVGSTIYLGAQDVLTKTIDEMKIDQEEYFKIHGEYAPKNEKELKKGVNIQTYNGPSGKGYLIIEETPITTTITDMGREERSQVIIHQASTTPL